MLQYFCLSFLTVYLCSASVIQVPLRHKNAEILPQQHEIYTKDVNDILDKWEPHIMDFLGLVDLEKVMGAVMLHINDPDVLNFVGFIFSPQFKEIVIEFEALDEFKEAVEHLQSKGYDIKSIINLINSQLDIPSIEHKKSKIAVKASNSGITKIIEEIIQMLPVEDVRKLFEEKLENSQEIKDLFITLSSEEFVDILKRLSENPKFLEIKKVFESFGLDLEYLGDILRKISNKKELTKLNNVTNIKAYTPIKNRT